VFRHTYGNPLFLSEQVHLIASQTRWQEPGPMRQDRSLSVPEGVCETIEMRGERLSPEAHRILTFAVFHRQLFHGRRARGHGAAVI
jgi:hypothetical protein